MKEIEEFEIIDGPHEGIRLDVPMGMIAPPRIVFMVEELDPVDPLTPIMYDLVVQPKTEESNEMVACYEQQS